MTDGWFSLDEFLKSYEYDAARWMSERDHRLREKTRDEPDDDRRRRDEPDPEERS